ncbi:hypothetical protein, partial [Nonomuraea diastatica]|uniref:hypothetical protein n=1 Tax=Nonomuraea diastatica TaxID=1848329 RepID=UPI001C70A086
LEAGRPDKPPAGRIDLTVSSPAGQQIYCEKIDIAVPASAPEGGGAYFTEKPQGEVIGGNWNPLSFQMKTGQELGLAATTDYFHVIFEPPPIPDSDLVNEPLQFRISGTLAATTGSGLTCLVTEYSGTTSDTYSRKDPLDLTLPTTEPAFYLHNFLSTAPDNPTIPRTKFTAGDAVCFTWESNGSHFQLYDGDGTTLYGGSDTFCTVPEGKVVNDTTFALKASATSGIDSQTTYQYATLTITINNPTLTQITATNGTRTPWIQGAADGKHGRVTFSDAGMEILDNAGNRGTVAADKADFNGVKTTWVQGRSDNDGRITFPTEGLNVRGEGGREQGTVFADKANLNSVTTGWVQGKNTNDAWIDFVDTGLRVFLVEKNLESKYRLGYIAVQKVNTYPTHYYRTPRS